MGVVGAAIPELLAERGIALRTGARAIAVRPGELELAEGPVVLADRVIALPRATTSTRWTRSTRRPC